MKSSKKSAKAKMPQSIILQGRRWVIKNTKENVKRFLKKTNNQQFNKEIFMKNTILIFSILTLFISGCTTYKQRSEGFGKMGYEETKLADGTYKLSYYGSMHDDEDDVKEKWKKRATELCGNDKFQSDVSTTEWEYNGFVILPPLLFITDSASSPLVEGTLRCKKKEA